MQPKHLELDFDMALLERNLKLSPEQRLIEHQKALDLFLKLQKIKVIKNEKPQRSLKKTS